MNVWIMGMNGREMFVWWIVIIGGGLIIYVPMAGYKIIERIKNKK